MSEKMQQRDRHPRCRYRQRGEGGGHGQEDKRQEVTREEEVCRMDAISLVVMEHEESGCQELVAE